MYIIYIVSRAGRFPQNLSAILLIHRESPVCFFLMKMKKTESSLKYIFEARKNIFQISTIYAVLLKSMCWYSIYRGEHTAYQDFHKHEYILKEVFVSGTIYPKVPAQKSCQLSLQPFLCSVHVSL